MCTKLCFLRQDEDTVHWPQTLIVNLLPVCYIRSTRFQVSGVGCQEKETWKLKPDTSIPPETLVTVMSP